MLLEIVCEPCLSAYNDGNMKFNFFVGLFMTGKVCVSLNIIINYVIILKKYFINKDDCLQLFIVLTRYTVYCNCIYYNYDLCFTYVNTI